MHFLKKSVLFLTVALLGVDIHTAASQTLSAQPPAVALAAAVAGADVQGVVLDGPAAPVAPAVVNRDEKGRATMRAFRITTPLTIDGRLNEEVYTLIAGAGDWVQQLPRENTAATEQTEMWVFYDDANLYISVRCLETRPDRQVANELRRDNQAIIRQDSMSLVIDTFYDRRGGYSFQTTPIGTLRDQQATDNVFNESWNTVWNVKSFRDEKGWYAEFVIPFKSLRYQGSGPQVWGINARRVVPWKNEIATLSGVPASYGMGGAQRMNVAGTLVGLETPAESKNLELKPYAISSLTSDTTAVVPLSNDYNGNVGFDFKYGITRGIIFDATVNTDFAQVEEDLQQVNLTRFSLFFPEKRDFFLEGQSIFAFGGASTNRDIPILFFSRQIGLNRGQSVPVIACGRLTGRVGGFTIGAINVETDDKIEALAAQTNFTAISMRRNVLRRSSIGLLATRRAPKGSDERLTGGIDGNFQFFQNISVVTYYAKTDPRGVGSDASYRGRFDYTGDRYGFEAEHLSIGEAFNPEVGFVRRVDFRRSYAQARFSPRTRRSRLVRRLVSEAGIDYIENNARTTLMNRDLSGNFDIEFNSSDVLRFSHNRSYEFIPAAFAISPGVVVPVGGYDFHSTRSSYNLGSQHKVSGTVALSHGTLYGGTRTETSYSGYTSLNKYLAFEPSLNLAWVDLPGGEFTARVLTLRTIITPSPRMMASSLIQFNAASHSLTSSARLRWEYTPGSEFFLVYSDGRNTLVSGAPELLNHSLAVKVTKLLRF